jgi:xanthine dehydrogenase iron-sulfur cluster and FAD-binding subunit A
MLQLSCTQGGCGACNVMMTTFSGGKPSFSSVNACIRPILSCDGAAITTTEGIGSSKKGLHPVQERIAACNGTQCGFCTPGHVMAMYSLLRDKASRPDSGPLSLAEVEERFDGNICRCAQMPPPTHIHTHTHTDTHTQIHTQIYTHTHARTRTHTHTHTHRYTRGAHTDTHACTSSQARAHACKSRYAQTLPSAAHIARCWWQRPHRPYVGALGTARL